MTIPRRPFMVLLVGSIAGCGGGAAATPGIPSELGPGEAPPVGATCYAYSAISQTTTVKPLAPAP